MTALRDALEHTTLGWIKPELDETLRQARVEIEGFVDDPSDTSRMRFCAGYLHQVQGTLRMVELYAPAMVTEEMERLAQALQTGEIADRDAACAILMRGVVLLPDYLERLQSGHRDIPIVLLPLLNELRAVRGEAGLSESVLFAPDMDRPLPSSVPPPAKRTSDGETPVLLERLRNAVATWSDSGAATDAAMMAGALDALLVQIDEPATHRMLWVATCVAQALRDAALTPGDGLRQAFQGVQREARRQFEDDGFGTPRPETALEPTRQLLFQVVHSDSDHASLQALRDTFELDAHRPSESELSHAQGSLSGRNRALLDTVSAALKEDLLRVKDVLDLHLRATDADAASLQPQVDALGRVADTLGMLGLGVARNVVQQQRDAMQAIVMGDRAADEGALLDVAGALLYVDATLDDQVARLGTSDAADGTQDDMFSSESRKLVEAIAREAIANFSDARQAFVAFVETSWDHAELVEVPRLLQEVAGALSMVDLPVPAAYLDGIRLYAEIELIGRGRVPNGRQLDTLADALASVEYYLEALRENRFNRDDILDIARSSLETLGYWPLPDVAPMPKAVDLVGDADMLDGQAQGAVATPEDAGLIDDAVSAFRNADVRPRDAAADDSAPTRAEVAVDVPVTGVAVGDGRGGFEVTGDEIDDEIREVFLEEFGEEIDNLDTLLPRWREKPDDFERLRPIRRVFHTLKGSGRLVGARVLGEFSWKIETVLNRVLEGTRPASDAVVAVVDSAFYTLPQLQAALRGTGTVTADLDAMQALAERVAAGEDVFLPAIDDMAAASGQASAEDGAPAESTLPASVDALLLEILDSEVEGHLVTVDAWLDEARTAPTPPNDGLLRAIHTMNGAFAMAEVPAINAALGPAETYVRRLLAADSAADNPGMQALSELAALIRSTVAALHATSPQVPTCIALAARIVALRDALPEVVAAPTMEFLDDDALFDTDTDASGDAVELTDLDLSEYGDRDSIDAVSDPAEAARLAAVVATLEDAERVEADRVEAERVEAERVEAERVEADRVEAERVETERVEADRVEADRVEAERVETERVETERVETDRVEADRVEAERAESERVESERVEIAELEAAHLESVRREFEARLVEEQRQAQADAERLETQRLADEEEREYARLEAEYAQADLVARENAEAQRAEVDRSESEKIEAERVQADRIEAERIEVERIEAERIEAERVEAERIEVERIEAERVEAKRVEAERVEAERVEAERVESDRVEAERVEFNRLESERFEVERAEAERIAVERAESERIEAERIEAELVEAERVEGERVATDRVESERAERLSEDAREAPASSAGRVPEQVAASAEDPDEALDLAGLDPELVDIFTEEAGDLLDHSDGLLAKLRDAPSEREPLVGLQRDLHTIKGGARMAGIMAIGELGHAMETLLEAVVEQRSELDHDGIPLLQRGFDRLHAMVTRINARSAIGMPLGLIGEFNDRAGGRRAASRLDEVPARSPAPKVQLKALSAPIGGHAEDDEDDITVRAPQEQVRIRADLLDRLVNYAGEVAIYRSRLEQQLGAFRGAMGEMEQTNMRLRDQLRRLDIETEAQIIARYQREHESSDQTFDPLELDRFSTLQQLSRALGESAADMSSLQGTLDDLTRQYETLLLQQSRVSSDLQEGLMRTRMVPFDGLVPRLRRVVRQAASDTGKQVQLKLDGAQGELDRNVLERMTAPLEHMLRNAVAHGLESPAQRAKAKKSEEGSVRIAIRREGSEVVLEVGDDGRGLDRDAIRRRGEERGLIRQGAVLGDSDLDALILEPGFSTADEVSRLSGRGVGMDVVASEVRQLGGTLDIASRPGEGTTFVLRLPQTLAVTQAVFVRIGETSFALPIASVRGVGRIARDAFGEAGATYAYGGEDYLVHDLGGLVGHAAASAEGLLQVPVLLIRSGDLRAAVAVDQILGNREIVVKPVGPQVASIPGIFGATVMGDGSVVVILDVAPLVRRQAAQPRDEVPIEAAELRRVPLVMVVDDSVTMRKVTGRVLERNNFEVATARDGIDALERMADRVPDLMLLDIEMPRMDGYELATQMKADPRLREVPIIMITSRTGEKHRQRAFEIGVERYLGKPYQENELIRNVHDLLKLEPQSDG